jgi:hypothetical protein
LLKRQDRGRYPRIFMMAPQPSTPTAAVTGPRRGRVRDLV